METTSGLFFSLVPLIVFLPVLGLLINMAFGGWMGEKVVGALASLAAGGAFIVSLLLAYSLSLHPETVIVPFAEWIHIGTLQLDWAFRVDTLSVVMMLVVSGVGTLIPVPLSSQTNRIGIGQCKAIRQAALIAPTAVE